jgi:tellurite resistance protein TerC
LLWTAFFAVVVAVTAIDLFASAGRPMTSRRALTWTAVWVSLSLGFAGVLYQQGGARAAVPYLTAYVIEYALSVDNLFVFLVVFSYFKVDAQAQHRLLRWGIIGAFLLRGGLIFLGTGLVAQFEWLLYGFGAFLLWTAGKLLFSGQGDEEVDPEANVVLRVARRVLPVSAGTHGLAFFVREAGRWRVTPLFLVLLVVETTDVLFALDSIPAVLGISKDPFIVFSSNAAAILGLRSLFFVVSSLMDRFRFLKVGLGVILAFVGLKLIVETAFHEWALAHETALIASSLAFIAVVLAVTVAASSLIPPPPPGRPVSSTPPVA